MSAFRTALFMVTKRTVNNGRDHQKGTDWLTKWKHNHPIDWNAASGKEGQIDVY